MMNFLSRYVAAYRRRRAIRNYARKLPRLLARDYGSSKTYTPQQVRKTVDRSGLNADYSCYAIAMFSGRGDFNEYHHKIGESCDYDTMRAEIADQYFHGNSDFTIMDISAAFADSGADAGHDGGGHDGAGGGDSGGGGGGD